MKKRIFCLMMAVLMLLTSVLTLASCGGGGGTAGGGGDGEPCVHEDPKHTGRCILCEAEVTPTHTDANHDGKCDTTGCKQTSMEVKHLDANHDGVCDEAKCGADNLDYVCTDTTGDHKCDVCGKEAHYDFNGDYFCDSCGFIVPHTHVDTDSDTYCDVCDMDMPVPKCVGQCIDANGDNKCDVCKYEVNCEHFDGNSDTKCDDCTAYVPLPEVDINYPWNETTIVIQLTENTNDDELLSVSKKYLAGELGDVDDVAKAARTRNNLAKMKTKVTPTYLYYPNTDAYGWGSNISRIETTIDQGGASAPDVYCLFIYDMVGASLKECFANLLPTSSRPQNYFEFNDANYDPSPASDRGYMYEYMESLTLAPGKKMYILSSDYFIDMVRSFFCIPVSIKLMNDYGKDIVAKNAEGNPLYAGGDRNEDGVFDIEDFYELVTNGEWTYDRIAEFSKTVYKPGAANAGTVDIADDIIGFAIDTGGLAASGLLYTTSVTIIQRTPKGNGEYEYKYPADNQDFYTFALKAQELFGQTKGVCVVNKDMNYAEFGSEGHLAIRKRFSENKILFGDIMLLGALEFQQYQNMKSIGGFGVVPVPVYKEGDKYLTQIHNMGSCGAIAINTLKFGECSAFLNYQSTHSEGVLNGYYEYNVKYGLATDSEGTVKMLQYLRDNVRSSFDKAMEDAIGVYMPGAIKWHQVLSGASYQIDVRGQYQTYYNQKQGQLDSLAAAFLTFPD